MLRFVALCLTTICLLPAKADEPPVRHRVLAADRSTGKIAIIGLNGNVEWEFPCKHDVHDLHMLPNGNILTHLNHTEIVEINPKKEIVWKYQAEPKEGYSGKIEIHAFQRLEDGNTMVAESGNGRIVEVDKDGKIIKAFNLSLKNPHYHRDTRMARVLINGHYLVCHEGDGCVREYNSRGKVIWEYYLDLGGRPRSNGHGPEGHGVEVYGAVRLPNGNTLIAGGNNNRVIEVTPDKKIVWQVDQKELSGITLAWVTTLQVLPNGNIIIGNCHAGKDNPQLIEIDRKKRVIWTFNNQKDFGNNLASAQVLDIKGKVIR